MATEFGKELFAYLKQMDLGVNTDIDPELLPPNQLSSARNLTVRGTFVRPRPKRKQFTLVFDTPDIQQAVETGRFQGATFYKPNFGLESVMASIGGRLFKFTPDGTGVVNVTEHTIPGDPNSSTAIQCWLWQAEDYIIWNDGINLPVFYDGVFSRRSAGPSVSLGTTAVQFTTPNDEENVTLTLTSVYNGALNTVVKIGDGNYIVVAVGSPPGGAQGYEATIENRSSTPAGTVLAVGTPIIVPGTTNIRGTTAAPFDVPTDTINSVSVRFTALLTGTGSPFWIAGRRYTVHMLADASEFRYLLRAVDPNTTGSTIVVPTGSQATYPQSTPITQPAYTIGALVVPATVPAFGSSVSVFLDVLYTGAANQSVTINNKSYLISPVAQAPPVPSITIIVKNLTANPNVVVAAGAQLLTIPELPIGRMGTYGRGRIWMSLIDAISFIAGDIVGGSSGSSAYNFRDSILKVTENTFLNGGGVFRVPSSGGTIRAMRFTATLDASLGQGPLQVFTEHTVFSCNAPVERADWQNITNPILTESLITNGGQGQNCTIPVNGDTIFRSIDGIRSLILGRREFSSWGNVPQSREVQSILDADDTSLIQYGSFTVFDNRVLMTASPVNGGQGIYFSKIIALNLDPISSIRGKAPSAYDGYWDGLNVLQLVTGTFSDLDQQWVFHLNTDTQKVELWELLKSNSSELVDQIELDLQSHSDDFQKPDLFKRLMDGEIFVDQLVGQLRFQAYYKPNQWPNWVLWHSWTVTTNPTTDPGYRPRMGLGEPSLNDVDNVNNTPLREAMRFMFRLTITGLTPGAHARFRGARLKSVTIPVTPFPPPA